MVSLNPYYARYGPELFPKGRQRFDQVWWDLNQSLVVEERWGDWIENIAPVRFGLFPEGLKNSETKLAAQPWYRSFPDFLEKRRARLTHVALVDEADVDDANDKGLPAVWWPLAVPSQFFGDQGLGKGTYFFGTPYGERAEWLKHPLLEGRLQAHPSAEQGTPSANLVLICSVADSPPCALSLDIGCRCTVPPGFSS